MPETSVELRVTQLLDEAVEASRISPEKSRDAATEALNLITSLLTAGVRPEVEVQIRSEKVTALLTLGQYYHISGQPDVASHIAREALAEAEAIGDQRSRAKACLVLGSQESMTGSLDVATEMLTTAHDIFVTLDAADGVTMTLYNLAVLDAKAGRIRDALVHYDQAAVAAAQASMAHVEIGSLIGIGTLHEQAADYDGAVTYYQRALHRARERGERYLEGSAIGNTATALYNAGRVEESLLHHREAFAIADELGNTYGLATLRTNEAGALLSLGRLREALAVYDEAIRLTKSVGNLRELIAAHCGRSLTLTAMGRFAKARSAATTAIRLARSLKDGKSLLQALTTHVEVSVAGEDYSTGKASFLEAYNLLQESQIQTFALALLQHGATLFERLRMWKRAYELRSEQQILFASIHNEVSTRRMQFHGAKLGLIALEAERKRLSEENVRLQRDVEAQSREITTLTLQLAEAESGSTPRTSVLRRVLDERFETLNTDFTRKLAERCPHLTPMELRICALLKTGLSTKELSTILHVTDRAVEKHRYNIRRKLGLDQNINLVVWLEHVPLQPSPVAVSYSSS